MTDSQTPEGCYYLAEDNDLPSNAPEEETVPQHFRCGMVSLIGRPSVGKSTLLNCIVGEKVTIVSKVPQTTRCRVRGIYNDDRGQIIFIDTPGLLLGKDALDRLLIKASLSAMHEVDCIIHLVDAGEPTGKEEQEIIHRLKNVKVPIILGLNKIDLKGKFADQYISLWEQSLGKPIQETGSPILLPLSGKTGLHVDVLIDQIYQFLPEGPPLYPRDTVCDLPQNIAIADIIREKLLGLLQAEVPHAVAVKVEEISARLNNLIKIKALILVDRESQKEIVIGKNGQMIKQIGILAREELEDLLECKIFLDLYVRCEKKWRDNFSVLQDLGYDQ